VEIEERLLTSKVDTHFCIIFDDAPIWILSLDRTFAASVVMFGFESARALSDRLEDTEFSNHLLLAVIARLGPRRMKYTVEASEVPDDAVWLVSGSLATTATLATQVPPTTRSLYLIDHHLRGSPRLPNRYSWQKVQHLHFGGATCFRTAIGSQHLALSPVKTSLRRTLAHIVDFAEPAYGPPQELAHSLDNRLHPDSVRRAVRYRTHRSTTGWGCRSLTMGELGIAFGMSSCFRHAVTTSRLFPFAPLQILDGILEALVSTRIPTSRRPLLCPPP
jgi:hypothetical protein